MWIDTHCHLDAIEFDGASIAVAQTAANAGVSAIVIPAVHPTNFAAVAALANQRSDCFYALGIHPMYVPTAKEEDLPALRAEVERLMALPAQSTRPPDEYAPGTWGPQRGMDLIENDGRRWLQGENEAPDPVIACAIQ